MIKTIHNLDQVTSVRYEHKSISSRVKVVEEGKYFFNLFTRKKHIWSEPMLYSYTYSGVKHPFNQESINMLVSAPRLNIIYNETEETFYDKPYAIVYSSNCKWNHFFFNTDEELDEFIKQFDQLKLIKNYDNSTPESFLKQQ